MPGRNARGVESTRTSAVASSRSNEVWPVSVPRSRTTDLLYGNLNPRESMPRLLSLYQEGKLLLDELVTTTYRLDDINQAFADLHAGTNLRGVIAFS
jgi:Zn-dependent alcohol dehydrogenase